MQSAGGSAVAVAGSADVGFDRNAVKRADRLACFAGGAGGGCFQVVFGNGVEGASGRALRARAASLFVDVTATDTQQTEKRKRSATRAQVATPKSGRDKTDE